MTEALTDTARVRLAGAGDEAAFASLVGEHHASMARVAYAITGNPDSAADAVQAAWATAWRRLSSLRDAGVVRAWLVAIAANEARQLIRRQRQRAIVDISSVTEPASEGDPGDRIATVDLARVLRALEPGDRTLLALRYGAGLDSSEIAAQLGISASGVRSRLARLLDRLRMELDHA
ncbi:MAG: sigma-70 family RNA polymerase sigma factor [Candidatus Limnocylindrales bacterium]